MRSGSIRLKSFAATRIVCTTAKRIDVSRGRLKTLTIVHMHKIAYKGILAKDISCRTSASQKIQGEIENTGPFGNIGAQDEES